MPKMITKNLISKFSAALQKEERSAGTIEKYCRDVRTFSLFLGSRSVTQQAAAEWKAHLISSGRSPVTINSMLIALNRFFRFAGWDKYQVRLLRVQRRVFRDKNRELTRNDYLKLLDAAAKTGKLRLALLMQSMCATGIRVSEVKFLTVESVQNGRADIALKGKIRTILLPAKLCRKLLKYAAQQGIKHGEIFRTRTGMPLSRKQIWAQMKALCHLAGVEASKVFPHNLRHLFALTFYHACHDIVHLADVLGHSSINTTRIYLTTTGTEHSRQLESLGLIL